VCQDEPFRHLLTPYRKYIPYSKCLKLHNGALKEEEDACAERTPSYRRRDRKSVYARNAAGKRAEEWAVEEELKDMVSEDGTPRKRVMYTAVGRIGSYLTVLANIVQARFGVAILDTKKEVRRQREHLATRIGKLEVERVGASGLAKAKLAAAIDKLQEERDALVE
jgi:hypothetical protein